jgi:hypothetical protein
MKKRIFFIIAAIMLLTATFLFAQDAEAYATPIWLSIVSSILTFVIGAFIPKTARGKVMIGKEVAEGLAAMGFAFYKSTRPDSDGGKKITGKEWEKILATGFENVKEVASAVGKNPEDLELPKPE